MKAKSARIVRPMTTCTNPKATDTKEKTRRFREVVMVEREGEHFRLNLADFIRATVVHLAQASTLVQQASTSVNAGFGPRSPSSCNS